MIDLEEKLNKLQKEYTAISENIKKDREKKEKLYDEILATTYKIRDTKIEEDPIFLLSAEEYEKYKHNIPAIKCRWWLRSPSIEYQNCASFIHADRTLSNTGNPVNHALGVRPVLKIDPTEFLLPDVLGRIIRCGITWIKIDKGLYIAEVPITFERFDKSSNKYEKSEIRNFLLDWYEERKDW